MLESSSESFRSYSKFLQSMGKNLLDYFTTAHSLREEGDKFELLRTLHTTQIGKSYERTVSSEELNCISDYFRSCIASPSFASYLFETFIENKIQKFARRISKVERLLRLLSDKWQFVMICFEHFCEEASKVMREIKLHVSAVFGTWTESWFLFLLWKEFQLARKKTNWVAIVKLLETAVIRSNLHKVLLMFCDSEKPLQLVEKLLRSRVMRRREKVELQDAIERRKLRKSFFNSCS